MISQFQKAQDARACQSRHYLAPTTFECQTTGVRSGGVRSSATCRLLDVLDTMYSYLNPSLRVHKLRGNRQQSNRADVHAIKHIFEHHAGVVHGLYKPIAARDWAWHSGESLHSACPSAQRC